MGICKKREAKSQEHMGGLISYSKHATHPSWAHTMNTTCANAMIFRK